MKHFLHSFSFRENSRIVFFFFSLSLFSSGIFAQSKNLVVNPSFEDYTYPPIRNWPGVTQPGEVIVPGWVTPTRGTADYYNSDLSVCDGFPIAKARTGEGRCALIMGLGVQNQPASNYKEYVEGKFTKPLEAGKKYCVKFYVALDHGSPYTTTGIGAYISPDEIRSDTKDPLPVQPQIITYKLITSESGWVEISGTYTANGGEQWITLGSFSDTSVVRLSDIGKYPEKSLTSQHIMRSAYFYIDDVSVEAMDETATANGKVCDCSTTKSNDRPGDYFLFLLDISGSMNKSGHLDLMKSEIVRFTQGLNDNNRIAVMEFSDNAKMLLPFTSPADSVEIDSTVNHLKSHGNTNGDFAILRVSQMIDSMHLPQRTHVIIATDGIFIVKEKTKAYADSILTKNNTSFCVLEFGNLVNDDLIEITQDTPGGTYNYVTKHNVPKILDQQLPPPAPDPSTVFYTDMATATGDQMIDNIFRDLTR